MPPKTHDSPVEAITCWSGSGSGGKTTVTLNTAAAHGRNGHKTLIIDLDPQKASITGRVGYADLMDSEEYNIAHTMFDIGEGENKDLTDLIIPASESGLDFDFIPAHSKLEDFGKLVATHWEGSPLLVLRWWIEQSNLRDKYDTIFVDVHGTKGPLVKSAITATENVIVPMLVNSKGERSAYSVQEYMDDIQETFGRMGKTVPLNLLAVVPNESRSYKGDEGTLLKDEEVKLQRLKDEGYPVTEFLLYHYKIHARSEEANGTLFEYAEWPVSGKVEDRHRKIFPKFDALSRVIEKGTVNGVKPVPFDELGIIDHDAVNDEYGVEEGSEETSEEEVEGVAT